MPSSKIKDDDFPDVVKPYRFHGAFEKSGPYLTSYQDLIGTCPFCGKQKAFAVNMKTGQFVCHSKPSICGRSGNVSSFLQQFAEEAHKGMNGLMWKRLVSKRNGIPAAAFKPHGVGYDPTLKRYLVPVNSKKGTIQDLRVMNQSGKKMGTAGRPAGFWNLDKVANFKDPEEAVLFIDEGEWDGMPLEWLLKKAKVDFRFCVGACPGARTVKEEWVPHWVKFGKVIVLGDNDEDGDAMAAKVWARMTGAGFKGELHYLNWPDTLPDGYDVSDHIAVGLQNEYPPRKIWRQLNRLIEATHRRMPFKGQEDVDVAAGGAREKVERPKHNPTFEETLKEFGKVLRMSRHHTMALQYCYSIYLATQWDDDPLWGYLVGAPGTGKSVLLCSLDGCPESMFYSSMQSKALVSGFKFDPDPSLIPEMIGRCSIFKDWTELLNGDQFALKETYGTLRGWFDGYVKRKFGNGVEREYWGRGNMLAGVTNAIHGMSDSILGERFLKFQLPRPSLRERRKLVMAAMMNTGQEKEQLERLQKASYAFVNRDMPKADPAKMVPVEYRVRIRALADLVAILRAKVEYTGFGFDKELSHRPEEELPTRLGKSLMKLAMANSVVLGKKKVDREVFRLVERVAFNTAHGFHLDILQAMMGLGGKGIVVADLAEASRMPPATMQKRITDLEVLGVINRATFRSGIQGRPAGKYTVAPSVRKLWEEANVEEDHIEEMAEARRHKRGWKDDDEES